MTEQIAVSALRHENGLSQAVVGGVLVALHRGSFSTPITAHSYGSYEIAMRALHADDYYEDECGQRHAAVSFEQIAMKPEGIRVGDILNLDGEFAQVLWKAGEGIPPPREMRR